MRIRPELGILLGACCAGLLLCEALLRLVSPSPYVGIRTTPPQDTFFQHDRLLGWRGVPHASGPFRGIDFDVTVRLDAMGYRNDGPPFVEAEHNLLVLGDSHGWGWGVGNVDLFHNRFMEMEEGWNVYNLSAPGYGTDQEYLVLRDFLDARPQRPFEGTLLLFYINDFEDVAATVRYSYPKPMFVLSPEEGLSLVNVPVPRSARRPARTEYAIDVEPATWMNSLQLYNFLTLELPGLWSGPAPDGTGPGGPPDMGRTGFDVTLALLERLSELNRGRGMFFHVVILMTHNVDPAAWQWEPLKRFMSERGIGFSEFRSTRIPNTDLWLDGHLSAYGHRKLAEHIAGVLPRSR